MTISLCVSTFTDEMKPTSIILNRFIGQTLIRSTINGSSHRKTTKSPLSTDILITTNIILSHMGINLMPLHMSLLTQVIVDTINGLLLRNLNPIMLGTRNRLKGHISYSFNKYRHWIVLFSQPYRRIRKALLGELPLCTQFGEINFIRH